ncbi:hypothetical protein [Thermococcus sp. 2319x1]|uniref:hypothetical protein n=1 Tax=Thermococcus sp. 2319x1 TaxID=1674923 RepID=UPI001583528B|nr:hypothetical protein [Thermococcus sp. 2319x1]
MTIYNPTDKGITIEELIIGQPTVAPTALDVGLEQFNGEISSNIVSHKIIKFTSSAEVPLLVLELGLWGSTYSLRLPYTLKTSEGTVEFRGYGSGKITQNNKVVTADIAIRLIFLKGSNKVIVWTRNAVEYSRKVFGYLDYITG